MVEDKSTENGLAVKVIYPKYVNMVKQIPCVKELFNPDGAQTTETADALFVPDKETLIKTNAEKIIISMLYGFILETAIGAQSATIMSMRSAYDAAVEYEGITIDAVSYKLIEGGASNE